MILSEISIYEFLKDKFKFTDPDARKYARQMMLTEEKLRAEMKQCTITEFRSNDFATKNDLLAVKADVFAVKDDVFEVKNDLREVKKDLLAVKGEVFSVKKDLLEVKLELQSDIHSLKTELSSKINHIEVTMEKGFAHMTRWIITILFAVAGLSLTIAKLFF